MNIHSVNCECHVDCRPGHTFSIVTWASDLMRSMQTRRTISVGIISELVNDHDQDKH